MTDTQSSAGGSQQRLTLHDRFYYVYSCDLDVNISIKVHDVVLFSSMYCIMQCLSTLLILFVMCSL